MILSRRSYRALSLTLAAAFAAVAMVFLIAPGDVVSFFNALSRHIGMKPAPNSGHHFYVALAVAYMYLVTLFAFQMARRPENKIYPVLLMQAKVASSLLSFGMFLFHAPYLIYLANGIVDGLIGLMIGLIFLKSVRPV